MSQPLPFDQRDGEVWFNGDFIPWQDAKIHFLSHGLHYASSVFEGERAYNGVIFREAEHTKRLFDSAQLLDMQAPYDAETITNAKYELLKRHNLKDAYIRPLIWRGSEMMAVSAQHTKINVAIAAWVWPSYFSLEQKLKGIELDFATYRRPHPDTAPYLAKAAGLYMICTLSKHKAEKNGFSDALMLDWEGYVAEATGANIFFSKDGVLHTPTPDSFLNGITRQAVIELAKNRNIDVVERKIKPEELPNFDECFLTGTAAEITPVSLIGSHKFSIGELTASLVKDYDSLVKGQNA